MSLKKKRKDLLCQKKYQKKNLVGKGVDLYYLLCCIFFSFAVFSVTAKVEGVWLGQDLLALGLPVADFPRHPLSLIWWMEGLFLQKSGVIYVPVSLHAAFARRQHTNQLSPAEALATTGR